MPTERLTARTTPVKDDEPAMWWRDPPKKRVDPDLAREACEEAAAGIADANEALACSIVVIKVLAERLRPPRTCDLLAERRVLGWLLSGWAQTSDFAGLDAYDFADPSHRWIYAFAMEVLEAHERGALGEHPWPTDLWPSRDVVWCMAFQSLEDSRCGARCHPALRTRTSVRSYRDRFRAIVDALRRLPYPERVPQREIDLVVALGNAWSVVEEVYDVAPYESGAVTMVAP